MSDRDHLIHYHAVTLTQARVFLMRGDRAFSFTLLQWAGNARRRLQALPRRPQQSELFA